MSSLNYYQFRNKHGKPPRYTPEELLREAEAYFKWVEENPLYETKLFAYKAKVVEHKIPRMRAMTIGGFCLFADIAYQTFNDYDKKEAYSEVIQYIKNTVKTQKFEGASADMLNANIISRDLGLADKVVNEFKDVTVKPPEDDTEDLS